MAVQRKGEIASMRTKLKAQLRNPFAGNAKWKLEVVQMLMKMRESPSLLQGHIRPPRRRCVSMK